MAKLNELRLIHLLLLLLLLLLLDLSYLPAALFLPLLYRMLPAVIGAI